MTSSRSSAHALTFIFITVLIDTIGFGIILPVTPELIMELTGEGLSRASLRARAMWQHGVDPGRYGRRATPAAA